MLSIKILITILNKIKPKIGAVAIKKYKRSIVSQLSLLQKFFNPSPSPLLPPSHLLKESNTTQFKTQAQCISQLSLPFPWRQSPQAPPCRTCSFAAHRVSMARKTQAILAKLPTGTPKFADLAKRETLYVATHQLLVFTVSRGLTPSSV